MFKAIIACLILSATTKTGTIIDCNHINNNTDVVTICIDNNNYKFYADSYSYLINDKVAYVIDNNNTNVITDDIITDVY